MSKPEEAVDKVLHGLRDVTMPAGMEHRILLAMERRAAQPAQTVWRRIMGFVPVRAAVTGGAACAVLLGAALWIATPHRSAPRPAGDETTAGLPAHEQAPETASQASQPAQPSLKRVKALQGSAIRESDALALEEMRAPSQPAPPLPLTQQEKLLLRVARRHDPEQVAMLNPEMRSRQELQAKVEFQEFFEPTPPVEEKSRTESTDKKGDTR